jgi:AcrR family transcriptional regulator
VLQEEGVEALTVRAVAARLGVTPMAVIARVGSRDAMVAAMLAEVFAGVAVGPGGPVARIAAGLRAYGAAAMAAPGAVTLMLSRPSLVPEVLQRLTRDVAAALAEAGLAPEAARLAGDILIDHSHGVLIAAALAPPEQRDAALASHEAAVRHLVAALLKG